MTAPQPSGAQADNSSSPPTVRPETSLLAVISLVAGILGLFGAFFAPLMASIVAIVCGHLARSRIARDPALLTGDGIALAGLIMGYIGIAMSVVGLMLWGAMFGVGMRILYDIWRQIESDTGGQLTEIFSALQAFV